MNFSWSRVLWMVLWLLPTTISSLEKMSVNWERTCFSSCRAIGESETVPVDGGHVMAFQKWLKFKSICEQLRTASLGAFPFLRMTWALHSAHSEEYFHGKTPCWTLGSLDHQSSDLCALCMFLLETSGTYQCLGNSSPC